MHVLQPRAPPIGVTGAPGTRPSANYIYDRLRRLERTMPNDVRFLTALADTCESDLREDLDASTPSRAHAVLMTALFTDRRGHEAP